jgi:outer membrane protein assembly factor BamA
VEIWQRVHSWCACRYKLCCTRFLSLWAPPSKFRCPPLTLVVHGAHGNCIGPHASYDYYVLGGPHSSRAYSIGELGPARSWLETALELRVPVPVLRTHAFVFAENARALSASDDLAGRPREFYGRPGHGTSTGVGLRLGALRVELARDCNKGSTTCFINFGERF